MKGEDFLQIADLLLAAENSGEPHWRAAVGRAYYALFLEMRDWLLDADVHTTNDSRAHSLVAHLISLAKDDEVRAFGKALSKMRLLRNQADYELPAPKVPRPGGPRAPKYGYRNVNYLFGHAHTAQEKTKEARSIIERLKRIDRDPVRRRDIVQSIKDARC